MTASLPHIFTLFASATAGCALLLFVFIEPSPRRHDTRPNRHLSVFGFGDPKTVEQRMQRPDGNIDRDGANHCSEQDISMLTASIRSNPELGLRPWSVDPDSPVQFSALGPNSLQVFRGKRILLLGDSTMWNLYVWMHMIFLHPPPSMATESLSAANEATMKRSGCGHRVEVGGEFLAVFCEGTGSRFGEQPYGTGTRLEDGTWIKFSNSACAWTSFVDDNGPGRIDDFSPDIIVANMGMHLLHFQDHGRNSSECKIDKWMNYEKWLEDIVVAAENAGTEYLFFKTTNAICSEKYINQLAEGNRVYSERNSDTISNCAKSIRAQIPLTILTMGEHALRNYCENGIFDDIGSQHLNRRLIEFVDARKKSASLKLAVFNDHDVQSCEYTGKSDGRHYHKLNLVRIRLLANLLGCLS